MIKTICTILLLLPFCLAAPTALSPTNNTWNYSDSGQDWTGECAIGHQQSPIPINSSQAVCDSELEFHLDLPSTPLQVNVTNLGYTLEIYGDFDTLQATTIDHVPFSYQAAQFHFHSPSEHVVDGKRYELEMHIVHQLQNTTPVNNRTIAVVAFLFEADENAEPNPLIDALHLNDGVVGEAFEFNLGDLLIPQVGNHPAFYAYDGSLTTPPCSQLVNWFLIRETLKITPDQLELFRERYAKNLAFAGGNGDDRELQKLYGRVVKLGGVTCPKGM